MNAIKREFGGKVVTLLLSLLIVVAGVGIAQQVIAEMDSHVSKTGATLEFLIKSGEESLDVSIRFTHELDQAEIADLEAQGLTFVRVNGEVAHSGTIYGAEEVSPDMLEILKALLDTVRIESTNGGGGAIPTLDKSVPEINADHMWQLLDGSGVNITGEGITVADFDSGIDVFHPDFWNADGGSYSWIDTNSNGTFDPGTDAVDMNRNSTADTGEILDFFDAKGPAGKDDADYGDFQADMDWLYNDANNNDQRDYGTGAGFTEADPTFGELIFIVDDTDDDNELDVGESLIALGTSKVRMTLNEGKTERTRGTDLILTENDDAGHGTSVCGIINGGIIGKRKYVGVAPDAELLVVDKYSNDYGETFYIPWARINGADVMLYEFGEFVLQFLDGSSNFETMIDNEASLGIVQVAAAGNLANRVRSSDKHAQHDVGANSSTDFPFNVETIPDKDDITKVIITVLWRNTSNDLSFKLTAPTTPKPSNVNLSPPPSGWQSKTIKGNTISYHREDSTRGTAKYDIIIIGDPDPVYQGDWTLRVTNNAATNEHVDTYIYNNNNKSKWAEGAVWTAFQSNENTVTWPATADSAITVAAYNTKGGIEGEIKSSSSVGPRLDGQAVVDVAAPGNWTGSALSKDTKSGGLGWYSRFGGTSAAAPHVAAAGALLLQWDNSLTHAQIKTMIQQNARTDEFTRETHNNEWGYGKLDVLAIVNQPPVSDANGPYQAECQYPSTTIPLNGTGSSDPNAGDVLTYSWSTDCSGGSFDNPTSPTPTLSVDYGCFSCNVSLTVTDLAGASDSSSATVTVQDTLDPSITCPADVIIECDQPTDPSNTGTATATDQCDPYPDVTFSDVVAPGTCPEEETITRTWTATDACGNFTTCVQTIEVVDTTPPVIEPNAPATITPPDAPISFAATATDNCDDDPSVEITGYDCYFFTKKGKRIDKTESCVVEINGDTITILDSGGVDDQIEWTIRSEDNCGNVAEATHTVSVVNPAKP